MLIDLVILKGGNSLEKDVAIKTFENVIENLDKKKYIIHIIEMTNFNPIYFINTIKNLSSPIVLNLLHGGNGEDGTIQGFLSMMNIKYIGSECFSSSICMNKNLTKTILKANNIPVIEQVFINNNFSNNLNNNLNNNFDNNFDNNFIKEIKAIKEIGYPVIIKPNLGGSSVGINIANNEKELINILNNNINQDCIKNHKQDYIIEKFIKGQEITCSIVQKNSELKVLSILDININNNNNFFDYNTKYNDSKINSICNIESSKLPKFMQTMINEISKKIFILLQCKDYINIDFIIKDDDIYVLEINTLPGLTKTSLLCKALNLNNYLLCNFLDDMITQNL